MVHTKFFHTIKIKVIATIVMVCVLGISYAQTFTITPRIQSAYDHIMKLELNKAQFILDQEKLAFPDNYLVYHIENYIDFFKCFISEEKEVFDQLETMKYHRLQQLEQGNQDSPYYLFSQAEVLIQWALARLKFEEYAKAVFEINKAVKLLEENQAKFPDFIANKKSLSAIHAIMGTVPPRYKYLLKYFTHLEGTINQGYQEIHEVLQLSDADEFLFYKESVVIKALIELHFLNNKNAAYQTIQRLEMEKGPLACFIKANIHHRTGHNDGALAILNSYDKQVGEFPLAFLEYQKGVYQLNKLEPNSKHHIENFLVEFKGQNYIKEAYQKLAWYELAVNNDPQAYQTNMRKVLQYGMAITDEDKQAQSEAQRQNVPKSYMLQARLLTDGAYFSHAKQILNNHINTPKDNATLLEFTYRMARVNDELSEYSLAKKWYLDCIALNNPDNDYFQASACLHLAEILEFEKNFEQAKLYYEKCLSLSPEQYKASLHQKAKSGKQRVVRQLEKG